MLLVAVLLLLALLVVPGSAASAGTPGMVLAVEKGLACVMAGFVGPMGNVLVPGLCPPRSPWQPPRIPGRRPWGPGGRPASPPVTPPWLR